MGKNKAASGSKFNFDELEGMKKATELAEQQANYRSI